jgi:hypothetical protein
MTSSGQRTQPTDVPFAVSIQHLCVLPDSKRDVAGANLPNTESGHTARHLCAADNDVLSGLGGASHAHPPNPPTPFSSSPDLCLEAQLYSRIYKGLTASCDIEACAISMTTALPRALGSDGSRVLRQAFA